MNLKTKITIVEHLGGPVIFEKEDNDPIPVKRFIKQNTVKYKINGINQKYKILYTKQHKDSPFAKEVILTPKKKKPHRNEQEP